MTERRIEAARSEMAATASQQAAAQACIVCCEAARDTFLNCGHLVACRACAERLSACPVCRTPISSRTRAFV